MNHSEFLPNSVVKSAVKQRSLIGGYASNAPPTLRRSHQGSLLTGSGEKKLKSPFAPPQLNTTLLVSDGQGGYTVKSSTKSEKETLISEEKMPLFLKY